MISNVKSIKIQTYCSVLWIFLAIITSNTAQSSNSNTIWTADDLIKTNRRQRDSCFLPLSAQVVQFGATSGTLRWRESCACAYSSATTWRRMGEWRYSSTHS